MKVQRTFIIGDQWLYYKIYCGVKTTDTILTEIIKPLTQHLLNNHWIAEWFFIRYNDPEPHLRIRFKIVDTSNLGNIIATIKNALNNDVQNDCIWKVTVGTYKRELERYGSNTMDVVENFFYIDSEAVLNVIKLYETEEERFMYTLKSVHDILSLCITDDLKKQSFLEIMQRSFKKEFNVERFTKKQLDTKYRTLQTTIRQVLTASQNEYFEISKLLKLRYTKLKPLISTLKTHENNNTLQVPIANLVASFIHMTINRSFSSKQRLYEMVIYDFLYRYYKSLNGRKNA